MRAYSRLALPGLIFSITAGACLSDVEYLRAGDPVVAGGGETAGGTPSSGGASGVAGTFTIAGSNAGKGGQSGGGTGGAGGSGGSTAGSAGTGGDAMGCKSPRIVQLFDFEDSMQVNNTVSGSVKDRWVKGPYDSTDTVTGKLDAHPNPASNTKNLAYLSVLDVDTTDGDPKPAMRFRIPFSPNPPEAQQVNLLYIFAGYAEPANAVNVSNAAIETRAILSKAPYDNCNITANFWTTGTDDAGKLFNRIDGPNVNLRSDKWVSIPMDLRLSSPATAINQYGFMVRSVCTPPMTGEGGASGAGTNDPIEPTVVLFDSIETTCD